MEECKFIVTLRCGAEEAVYVRASEAALSIIDRAIYLVEEESERDSIAENQMCAGIVLSPTELGGMELAKDEDKFGKRGYVNATFFDKDITVLGIENTVMKYAEWYPKNDIQREFNMHGDLIELGWKSIPDYERYDGRTPLMTSESPIALECIDPMELTRKMFR